MQKQAARAETVDIAEGRWVLSPDPSVTWNFGFLPAESRLRRTAAGAEKLVHTQPSASIARLRLFAELLSREIAAPFGVQRHRDLGFSDLLHALRSSRGPGEEVLRRLHDLRRRGNAASHEGVGSAGEAIANLKDAHWLARWFAREVLRTKPPEGRFQLPPDPRKQLQALLDEVEENQRTSAAREKELASLAEQLNRTSHRVAEVEAQAARSQEELRSARADAAAAEELALEAERRSLRYLQIERRVTAVKQALVELGLDDASSVDLPDWAAGVAGGAEPPARLELPEEVLEDLHALGGDLGVQLPVAPALELRSSGRLRANQPFSAKVLLRRPGGTSAELRRDGSVWVDEFGRERLLPPDLAAALDELSDGPPTSVPDGEDLNRARKLWWARLRRRLETHAVVPDTYLTGVDAVEVEKFKPRLVTKDDGSLELLVTVGDLDPAQVTHAVDRMRDPRSTRLVGRTSDGKPVRTELLLSPRAAASTETIRRLRRTTAQVAPQLLDAPASLLDPELFDLSEYGDRVVGFGRVVYRVQPTILPNSNGERSLQLKPPEGEEQAEPKVLSPEKAAELAGQLEAAARAGQSYLSFEEDWVRVPPLEAAHKLLEPSSAPARSGSLVVAVNLEEEQFFLDDTGRGTAVPIPDPPGLAPGFGLFPHQREGLAWLAGHALVGERSSDHGLLADDMGLGKTLQVLSLMSLLEQRGELGPALVVAPLSLLENWYREARRFFPGRFARWITVGGASSGTRPTAAQLQSLDVVATSYESLRSQQLEFGRVQWKLMVLDESDRVRNPTTRTNHAVLAMSAERRLALTGTPIQNSLVDLWAQFDWLSPGLLGDLRSFRDRFVRPVDDTERAGHAARLRKVLDGRVLRRLKEDVLADKLPPKTVRRNRVEMSPRQADLYEQVLAELAGGQATSLGVMHRLFQVCSAPGMLAAGSTLTERHPKLLWLMNELEGIAAAGEKVAVFAEWYAVQDQLATAISNRFRVPVDRVNGKLNARRRLQKIEAFQQRPGFGAIVLGPKATGVGLNITGANHVVHFTRHWNPALESQATDRVYRIGQDKPVTAHLPIMVHPRLTSIEEHLDRLLTLKSGLARDFLSGLEDLDVGKELNEALLGRAR